MFYAAFAVVAGYSCAHAQTTRGTDDQTAFGVPRVALHGAPGVGLPQPLTPGQAARIRRIFALQAAGHIAEATQETDQLGNTLLLGPILADRYLGGFVHPTQADLTRWLAAYGDQSDAPAIRALLARLAPQAASPPTVHPAPGHRLGHGAPASAQTVRTLFVRHRDTQAVADAMPALLHPSPHAAPVLYIGGLAAWRLGNSQAAALFFRQAYRLARDPGQHAAAAYWAARTAQQQGNRGARAIWLRRAARYPETFYGHIAGHILRAALSCVADDDVLGTADVDALAATPQGRRAFALLQVGQTSRAEAELRALWDDAGQTEALARPLALLARAVGMPGFETVLHDAVYVAPAPPRPPTLRPAGGFVVDPSLVYALVHHESDFRTMAVSSADARGLMQIKPATARWVGGRFAMTHLHDPAVNLAVGQKYLLQLAHDSAVDGDLIRLLAAYAEGPAAEQNWAGRIDAGNDPLLFIEAIPEPATRHFVEDVLTWSWRYAALLGTAPASLDDLAEDRFPRLVRADRIGSAADTCGMLATRRYTRTRND